MTRKRLGDMLIEVGLLTQTQLRDILEEQKQTNERLGEVLIRMGYMTEQQLIEVLEFQLGIPHVNLYRYTVDPAVAKLIPESLARRYGALAIRRARNKLYVAMADPLDFYAIDDLRMSTGFPIETALAGSEALKAQIDRVYGLGESMDELKSVLTQDDNFEREVAKEDSPIARLMTQLIDHGLKLRASDIHIEPQKHDVLIRYRVDGYLRTEQTIPKNMLNMLVARVKILANLNIAERRLPQDGRFQMGLDVRQVDLRVSTMPTVHGEKCVLRLFDLSNALLTIDDLELSPANRVVFERMLHSPYGMVLLTGPTGSGKTTTLYAGIAQLMSDDKNIVTIEDPVEFDLAGINQVQVNTGVGLTFATGLRSVLRQDPDIIMVGEIRDTETADIAVRTAMTGHLIFSTLHTNNAVSALNRLVNMGIEPFLVASAVVGVVAQRLVRRVCDKCCEPYEPTDVEREWLAQHGVTGGEFRSGHGCGYCGHTGYRGRVAIHEVMQMTDRMRSLILDKRPASEYLKLALEEGMSMIVEDGIYKVVRGLTSFSEVMGSTLWE